MRTAIALLDAFDVHLLRGKADAVAQATRRAADARIRAALTTHVRAALLNVLDHDPDAEWITRPAVAKADYFAADAAAECDRAIADLAQAARRVRSRHWREQVTGSGTSTRTMIRALTRAIAAQQGEVV